MSECTIDGCEKPHRARGWCSTHWIRWRSHGDPLYVTPRKTSDRTCDMDSCENKHYAKGFCEKHYQRWMAHGAAELPERQPKVKPICSVEVCDRLVQANGLCAAHAERQRSGYELNTPIRVAIPFEDRFVVSSDGCWEWTGYIDRNGYGKFKGEWAHRASFVMAGGTIPAGFHLDHLCRNTICVNPDHLEPVTPRENFLRGENQAAIVIRQGKCIRGHERTPENIQTSKSGLNHCIPCARERRAAS